MIYQRKQIDAGTYKKIEIHEILFLVISLLSRNERRNTVSNTLTDHGIIFSFVDAINGNLIEYSTVEQKLFTQTAFKYLSSGSIGCILSHSAALKKFIESNKEYCIILEDDIIIHERFRTDLESATSLIPSNFDLFYLASGIHPKLNLSGWVTSKLFVPLYPRSGQFAYLVSRKGAEKLINKIFPVKIVLGGIDTIIGRLITKNEIIAYHNYPNLLDVDLSIGSDIYNLSKPNKEMN
jgi:GR25 family glycosyltransferase involved in LPS biosynthesis